MPTIRKIQERLESPTTLGYSCAGVVAAVGSQVDEFRVGDRVACIGETVATHAEYNAVPRTLVAPVPNRCESRGCKRERRRRHRAPGPAAGAA